LVLSISAALLLSVAVIVLVRWAGLRAWHATVCVLAGFYLASSQVAPTIARISTGLVGLISGH
jgi:hypothetical protein